MRLAISRRARFVAGLAMLLATPIRVEAATGKVPWAGEPYPRSELLAGIDWDWSSFRKLAEGSDNWPVTWAADGKLYASYGDGNGFAAKDKRYYVSLGLTEVTGCNAASFGGRNLIGGTAPSIATCMAPVPGFKADTRPYVAGTPCYGKGLNGKTRGLLALGEDLYLWLTPGASTTGYKKATLVQGPFGQNSWTPGWSLSNSTAPAVIFPTLLQAGQDHRDLDYVYTYAVGYAPYDPSRLSVQRGPNGGEVYLLRARRTAVLSQRSSWQYFAGLNGSTPRWSSSGSAAKQVLRDKNGAGPRVSAAYVKQLGRYILMTEHTFDHSSSLGMFEGPNPWGPWKLAWYDKLTNGKIPATAFFFNFLPNSFSADGREFTLVFSGNQDLDGVEVLDGRFLTSTAKRR